MPRTTAVYIHVPFCVRKCPYCDFYSEPLGPRTPPHAYLEALLRELDLRRPELQGRTITSVYFGGGTPSLLPASWVEDVLNRLNALSFFSDDVEITLECNPATVERGNLGDYRPAGVNRLSLGVQSLDPATLRFLGRIHSADEAREALRQAKQAGFDNIGADLIFGVPGQDLEDVLRDADELLSAEVEHLSAYELTVAEGTPLATWVAEGRVVMPDDSLVAEMFLALHDRLEAAGFEHYEVSNYARPNRRSRHNLTYWRRGVYVGFGPSAHSFDGTRRFWNVASWKAYATALSAGNLLVEGSEVLTAAEALEEEVILGLRLADGLDLRRVAAHAGESARTCLEQTWHHWSPFLTRVGHHLRPSARGLLHSDRLAVEILEALASCTTSRQSPAGPGKIPHARTPHNSS